MPIQEIESLSLKGLEHLKELNLGGISDLSDFNCGGLGRLLCKKSLWIGKMAPISCDMLDITGFPNCRAPKNYHKNYEVVWIYENQICEYGNSWSLVVDESIRIVGESGYLVLRTKSSGNVSFIELKSMLESIPFIRSTLEMKENLYCGSIASVFKIERKDLDNYFDRYWLTEFLSKDYVQKSIYSRISNILSSFIKKTILKFWRSLPENFKIYIKYSRFNKLHACLKKHFRK